MFFNDEKLTIIKLDINSKFKAGQKIPARHSLEVTHTITLNSNDLNKLDIQFSITMSVYSTNEELVNSIFEKKTIFTVTKFKDDDFLSLKKYVKSIFEEITEHLSKEIPLEMLQLRTVLNIDFETEILSKNIFSELTLLVHYDK